MEPSVRFTYYLDLISSWCFYAEPMLAALKRKYADHVEFQWRIALIDATGMPVSRAQEEWFYRRSGTLVRWPVMLNAGWFEDGRTEYLAPNLVAEAAREFGFSDDRIRLALTRAALMDGRRIGRMDVAIEVAAAAGGMDANELRKVAEAPVIEQRVRASTAEFHALKINQRPAFVLESCIGDRAVFSGLIQSVPLESTIDAMLADVAGYRSHKAHHGGPPAG